MSTNKKTKKLVDSYGRSNGRSIQISGHFACANWAGDEMGVLDVPFGIATYNGRIVTIGRVDGVLLLSIVIDEGHFGIVIDEDQARLLSFSLPLILKS